MAKFYPEVYYSNTIQDLLKKEPPFRPQPDYPSRPGDEGSLFCGILLIGGGICAIIGLMFAIGGGEDFAPLLIGGIIAVALSLIITKSSESIRETQFQNSDAMRQYKEALRRWENDKALTMTSERLRDYRKQCYADLDHFQYASSVFSDRDSTERTVKKGATESLFSSELSQSGLFHLHGPMHVNYYQYSYYPDIVISSADGKILFDLEIDEPYTFEDGSPIHYLNEEGFSVDSDRNEAFVAKGFCVVRFSEEQIIRHSQECINYLQTIINSIKNGYSIIPKPTSDIIQAKWSLPEARRMASTDYRRTYLPPSLQSMADAIPIQGSSYEPHIYDDDNDDMPF